MEGPSCVRTGRKASYNEMRRHSGDAVSPPTRRRRPRLRRLDFRAPPAEERMGSTARMLRTPFAIIAVALLSFGGTQKLVDQIERRIPLSGIADCRSQLVITSRSDT